MYFSSFDERGLDSRYVGLRKEIDVLCDTIVAGRIAFNRAIDEYDRIEIEYSRANVEGIELFRMIYKNRIIRLSSQFLPEAANAI